MPPVPLLSAAEVMRAFENLGWKFDRKHGSHIIMIRPGHPASLSIPDRREVKRGTLRSLIRAAGITVEEFLEALDS